MKKQKHPSRFVITSRLVLNVLCWLSGVVCNQHFAITYCRLLVAVLWKQTLFIIILISILLHMNVISTVGIFWMVTFFHCFMFVRTLEHNLLYQSSVPDGSRRLVELPSAYYMPHYENVQIPSSGCCTLHAYMVKPQAQVHGATVLYFHGNAGNIGHRMANVSQWVHECQCNVLIVDYRGYGLSSGVPHEEGLYQDAKASLKYLLTRSDVDRSRIFVFGRSLGGAVSVRLCSDLQFTGLVRGVILENTFTSLPELAQRLFPFLARFIERIPECIFFNHYPSLKLVPSLRMPVLFISGLQDTLVPPQMMQQLHAQCGSSIKELALFAERGHNDTWTSHGYVACLNAFLQKALAHVAVPSQSSVLQM